MPSRMAMPRRRGIARVPRATVSNQKKMAATTKISSSASSVRRVNIHGSSKAISSGVM